MKKLRNIVYTLGLLLFVFGSYRFYQNKTTPQITSSTTTSPTSGMPSDSNDLPLVSVVAEGLETPWALVFLPDNSILVTERQGTVRLITNGQLDPSPVATIENTQEIGEGGLLGITIHPDFAVNGYVYLYYTYSSAGDNTLNRVVRMKYSNKTLSNETIIVDAIPGASNHNGGRIKFGPDNYLYIATGDAQEPSESQNTQSLAGKILRVTADGKPVPGNPFNNPVYSFGHRNVQGLAWNSRNNLWATEHGRSGIPSGLDELNLIASGKNYGWPDIQGDDTRSGMERPQRHSGNETWAPSGAAFVNNSLFFSGLRGQGLYEAEVNGEIVTDVKKHFANEYGRIREVVKGPDGTLYITTSNKDGRGVPAGNDDRILRVNPQKLP